MPNNTRTARGDYIDFDALEEASKGATHEIKKEAVETSPVPDPKPTSGHVPGPSKRNQKSKKTASKPRRKKDVGDDILKDIKKDE